MDNIIEVNIDHKVSSRSAETLYEGRKLISELSMAGKHFQSDVTIWVQAYNKLEKTKRCIESILKYTDDVDYDLLLVDNGSEDGTFEYFKSLPFPKKTIIRINNNIGSTFSGEVISLNMFSKYLVSVANDLIVTKNWLSNMLKVMESDETIGMVNPVSSNVSNLQCVDITYSDWDDMQKKAAFYNRSDPAKWQERLRLITLGTLYRKECIYAIGWPIGDVGFLHDFVDDDITFRVRRAGYKAVLAGDTWICHDHPSSERNAEKLMESLRLGRENFKEKYNEVDAWNDVNNYIFHYLGSRIKKSSVKKARILGVDTKCGTPILDIKNRIREYGIFDAELSAFSQNEKYMEDLRSICTGIVSCDREEYFRDNFPVNYFDYIIIGQDINRYHEPQKVLLDAYNMLKENGQLLISLKNTFNIYSLFQLYGMKDDYDGEFAYNYTVDAFWNVVEKMGMNISYLCNETYNNGIPDATLQYCKNVLSGQCEGEQLEEMYARMLTSRFWFSIEK